MAAETYLLYIVVLSAWIVGIILDRGVGVGPRLLFGAMLFCNYLLGPVLYAIFQPDLGYTRTTRLPLEPAVLTMLFGFGGFLGGAYYIPYWLDNNRRVSATFWLRLATPVINQSFQKVGVRMVTIGIVTLPFLGFVYGIPTVRALASQFAVLPEVGLLILAIVASARGDSRRLLLLSGSLLVFGSVRAILTGSFGYTLMSLVAIAGVNLLGRQVTPWRSVLLLCVLASGAIPLQIWLAIRSEIRASISQGSSLDDRLTGARSSRIENTLLESIKERVDFSEILAEELMHTPAVQPHAYGMTFLEAPVAIVPRFLWPDKPYVAGGGEFVTKYSGIYFGQSTSVGGGIPFELYANFGVYGIIIGLAFFGYLLYSLENWVYRRGLTRPWIAWTGVWLGYTVALVIDNVAILFSTIPSVFLVGWLLRYLLTPGALQSAGMIEK